MSVAEETEPITLPQVVARLKALEAQVDAIGVSVTIRVPLVPQLEFIILIDGQEVWRGRDEEAAFQVVAHAPADAEVAMDWHAPPFVHI